MKDSPFTGGRASISQFCLFTLKRELSWRRSFLIDGPMMFKVLPFCAGGGCVACWKLLLTVEPGEVTLIGGDCCWINNNGIQLMGEALFLTVKWQLRYRITTWLAIGNCQLFWICGNEVNNLLSELSRYWLLLVYNLLELNSWCVHDSDVVYVKKKVLIGDKNTKKIFGIV